MNWRLVASASTAEWMEAVRRNKGNPPPVHTSGTFVKVDAQTCVDWRSIRDWIDEMSVRPTSITGCYEFVRHDYRWDRTFLGLKFHFEKASDALYFGMMFNGEMLAV